MWGVRTINVVLMLRCLSPSHTPYMGFTSGQLLLEMITVPHKLWTSVPLATHFLDGFSSGGFCVFSRFDARYCRCENLHASGRRRMRRPTCKFRRCTCTRVEMNFKNANMVFCYEQNSYTNIDARDGRDRDALLRASARKLKRICQFWVGLNLKSPRTRPKPYLIPLVLHIVQCRFYYM